VTTKSEKLLAVYARLSRAIAAIPDSKVQDLHRLAGGVPQFVAEALLREPKPTSTQIAEGLELGLRELAQLTAEVDSPWRPAVSRALHEALSAEYPELLDLERQHVASILARRRIDTEAEFHAVRQRIEVLEGEPELGEELKALYALVSAHGPGA
jgi:hypothetical protein